MISRFAPRLFSIRDERRALRFCLLFSLYSVVAFGLLYWLQRDVIVPASDWVDEWVVRPALEGVVGAIRRGLRQLGFGSSASEPLAALLSVSRESREQCRVVYEIGLLAALLWAYPASTEERIRRLLSGAVTLYALSVLCGPILLHLPSGLVARLGGAHVHVWHTVVLAIIATLWLRWTAWVRPAA